MAQETSIYPGDIGKSLGGSIGSNRINPFLLGKEFPFPDSEKETSKTPDTSPTHRILIDSRIKVQWDYYRHRQAYESALVSVSRHYGQADQSFYESALVSLPRHIWGGRQLESLKTKVNEAKERILRLEEDWDDAGCPAYKPETLDAAAQFLYQIDNPEAINVRIAPASEGSIDLHWKTDKFELLINFHSDNSVSYYGDDYNGNLIRGGSCPKPELISCWMKHTSE